MHSYGRHNKRSNGTYAYERLALVDNSVDDDRGNASGEEEEEDGLTNMQGPTNAAVAAGGPSTPTSPPPSGSPCCACSPPTRGPVEDVGERLCQRATSCRWVLGYMCCLARFCQSAIRQCMGMAVVCMTDKSASPDTGNSTVAVWGFEQGNATAGRYMEVENSTWQTNSADFVWSSEFEGLILNAYNIGYICSPIIGGHLASRYGGKRVILVALLVGCISTVCLPIAANFHESFVAAMRIVAGLFLGAVDPAIQALWSKWTPKFEKAQLTTCSFTGVSLAGIFTFFISAQLCSIPLENGWPFIFYFFGGIVTVFILANLCSILPDNGWPFIFYFFCSLSLVCLVPWVLLVHDSPQQHPRIKDYEVRLITKGQDLEPTGKKLKTPWKAMLTSRPFWAIMVGHMTYTWVTTWIMSYLPKYLRSVMNFSLEENGLYSSLPFVGRMVAGFICSYLSDKLQHTGRLSTVNCRKLFQAIGSVGGAACTLWVGFLDREDRALAVGLLVLAMAFQNVTSVAFRINHLDIAPRFAGTMMGFTLTAAMAFGLSGAPITAEIIKDNTQEEWLIIFAIAAALNIIGGVVFCLFASGEVQPWALAPNKVVTVCDADTTLPSSQMRSPSPSSGIKERSHL